MRSSSRGARTSPRVVRAGTWLPIVLAVVVIISAVLLRGVDVQPPQRASTAKACDAFHEGTRLGHEGEGAGSIEAYEVMATEAQIAAQANGKLKVFAESAKIVAATARDPSGADPGQFAEAGGVLMEECGQL